MRKQKTLDTIVRKSLKAGTGTLTRPTFGQVWSTAMLVLQNTFFDAQLGLA